MKNVLVIEAQMKQYRVPFYARLYESLHREGVRLQVAYSDPPADELGKKDNCELSCEYGIKVAGRWLLSGHLLYQPLLREIRAADLVISDQANKLVLTHYLLLLSRLRRKRVAFWGHGNNRQEKRFELSERYRKWSLNWVTWWFAYTAGTADYLERQGVPSSKITVVQNSVDTREIRNHLRDLSADAKASLRLRLGISARARVGIFVGALNRTKCVSFLLEASRRIRASIPDFQLILAGGGPEEEDVRKDAAQNSWTHVVGPKFGDAKAELLGIADVFLLPGTVGLAILDAFAAGLPLVTTTLPSHGPEIEYLNPGQNGLITGHDPSDYARAVADLLAHPEKLKALRAGATLSAEKYSIEKMVENFHRGIQQCLSPERTEQTTAWIRRKGVESRHARAAKIDESTIHPRCLMTTSWDDGHPLDLRIAELLEKYGLTGTFYVPRAAQQAVMDPKQIRTLSASFEIGAHTLDHIALDRVSDDQARSQLSGSRRWIEDVIGKRCSVFCFPAGKFRNRQLTLVSEAGFQAARTVELLSIGYPVRRSELFLIPTTVQAFRHGFLAYAKNALKRPGGNYLVRTGALLHSRDWMALAQHLLLLAIERRGMFHLWGHSWEMEQQSQWDRLEGLLKIIAEHKAELIPVTNLESCGVPARGLDVEAPQTRAAYASKTE